MFFFLPHCVFSVAYNNASKTTTHVNALSLTHTHKHSEYHFGFKTPYYGQNLYRNIRMCKENRKKNI